MIAGTIVMEDITIHFRMDYVEGAPAQVTYTAANALKMETETRTVDADGFFKALGMAMQQDGEPMVDTPDLREAVEAVQPTTPSLRFIP